MTNLKHNVKKQENAIKNLLFFHYYSAGKIAALLYQNNFPLTYLTHSLDFLGKCHRVICDKICQYVIIPEIHCNLFTSPFFFFFCFHIPGRLVLQFHTTHTLYMCVCV